MCVNPLEREMMSDYTYVVVAASVSWWLPRWPSLSSLLLYPRRWLPLLLCEERVAGCNVSAVKIFNIMCDLPRKHNSVK